jgi:hypothetical protein
MLPSSYVSLLKKYKESVPVIVPASSLALYHLPPPSVTQQGNKKPLVTIEDHKGPSFFRLTAEGRAGGNDASTMSVTSVRMGSLS